MTWCGILENLLSDVIFLVIVVILSWLWIYFRRRVPLQNFFGVSDTKRLIIYLSNIGVMSYGSIGVEKKKLSFQGETVSFSEMQMANRLQNLFSFIVPRLAESLKPIGKLLFSDVDVLVEISPRSEKSLESVSSYIALGSPGYNTASGYIENTYKDTARFVLQPMRRDEVARYSFPPSGTHSTSDNNEYDLLTSQPVRASAVASIYTGGTAIPSESEQFIGENKEPSIVVEGIAPITDTLYGFVERIVDPVSKRKLFYVASLSEYGTKQSAYFLATQWKSLYRKYEDNQSFLVMLKFDNSDLTKWSIIFERVLTN
jgi:hypothetical protein